MILLKVRFGLCLLTAQAKGFLLHKDKVIVSLVFRGREMAHIEEGQRVMQGIVNQLEDVAKIESPPQQLMKMSE